MPLSKAQNKAVSMLLCDDGHVMEDNSIYEGRIGGRLTITDGCDVFGLHYRTFLWLQDNGLIPQHGNLMSVDSNIYWYNPTKKLAEFSKRHKVKEYNF